MKIITWNCRGKFKDKVDYALAWNPDVLIVQECSQLTLDTFPQNQLKPNSVEWIGQESKKGLGVFTFSDFKLEILKEHKEDFKYIFPLRLYNSKHSFLLLAVWTHFPYVKQLINAVDYYSNLIHSNETIIAGDFNSNSYWDYQSKKFSHSNLVKMLNEKNIHSTYHKYYNEEQGKETKKTHFHSFAKKEWQIDYCFVSNSLLTKLKNVEIGEIKNSDHAPLTAIFKL